VVELAHRPAGVGDHVGGEAIDRLDLSEEVAIVEVPGDRPSYVALDDTLHRPSTELRGIPRGNEPLERDLQRERSRAAISCADQCECHPDGQTSVARAPHEANFSICPPSEPDDEPENPEPSAMTALPGTHRETPWRARLIARLEARDAYSKWVLFAALSGMFAATFPITILTVSLPSIAHEFGTRETTMAWVIAAPMLVSAVTLPLLG